MKPINTKLNRLLKRYDYQLPQDLIAQKPASPRDAARLLIYGKRSKQSRFDVFKNLARYLPENAVLVFNQTKVWPARLILAKPTGGKIQILYLGHNKNSLQILANKKMPVGAAYSLLRGRVKVSTLEIIKKQGKIYHLKPAFPISRLPAMLKACGLTPLPPYIKHTSLSEREKRREYQSIFAKTGLSVAAPTASLHFTKTLMAKLRQKGIALKFVQLDVNLGTFAPLREQNLKTGLLHEEFYSIDKATAAFLNRAKAQGRPMIAVGTTVARTLEAAAKNQRLARLQAKTKLFIQEGYSFQFLDGLITNFHVPKSSLLMLVSALAGRKQILNLYQQAIKKDFRFFSFGDGMLILPN